VQSRLILWCLFSCPFCQDLLDSLLFFQQESSHDALLHATSTSRTSVRTRNSSLSLLQGGILVGLHVLNSWQTAIAVTAFGSIGPLVYALLFELATRSSHGASLVLPSVVGMTSRSCPTRITHVTLYYSSGIRRRLPWTNKFCRFQRADSNDGFITRRYKGLKTSSASFTRVSKSIDVLCAL